MLLVVHLQQLMAQIQFLVQLHQQVVVLEVLQTLHNIQEIQEDLEVVVLGMVDLVMLEVVIHLPLILLKELMVDLVQGLLVMQEEEVEAHFQLVLLPHNLVDLLVEQVEVEQHLVLQDHQ